MALSEEESDEEEGEEIYCYLGPPSLARPAAESMLFHLALFLTAAVKTCFLVVRSMMKRLPNKQK